jgi:4-amino-4-deoxy-L-arabinose transferase-like glycosyltransferase
MMVRAWVSHHRRDLACLLPIVLLAAGLRMVRSDVVEYFHDDAMLATLALELAGGLRLPLTGILSSTGIPNSPVSVYLLAIPFSLSSDPAFVIHLIMLWNVIGVALLWLLARRFAGWRIALLAGLLYAVNPWAILFSRKIWAQELHTPIILLGLLLLLYGYWEERDRRRFFSLRWLAQALSLPILLVGFQFHFASLPLLLLIPIALWLGRKNAFAGALILGFVLSSLVILPYAIGLAQTLVIDPARISDAVSRSADRGFAFSTASLNAIFQLATGGGLEHWLAPDQAAQLAQGFGPLPHLNLALLPFLLIGMAAAYQERRQFWVVLLIWAYLPGLLLLIEWTPVYIHYFIPSIPALALTIGFGGDRLLRFARRKRHLPWVFWLGFVLLLAQQTQMWIGGLRIVADRHVPYPGFTTPLAQLLPLRDRLSAADDALIVAGGMSWNLHHEVAVWDTLLWDRVSCARTIVPEGYAVFPARPFAAVIAPNAPSGPITDVYRNESAAIFTTRAGGADYTLYQWEHAPLWTGSTIHAITPERFENNVRLSGYGLADDQVTLEWRLPARQVGADYQFSAQLFDARGERLSQLDASFWHGRHWCAGDRLLTWGPIDTAASTAILKVALYQLGAGKDAGRVVNLQVLDRLGNPKGQSVDIPLDPREP